MLSKCNQEIYVVEVEELIFQTCPVQTKKGLCCQMFLVHMSLGKVWGTDELYLMYSHF